MSAQAGGFEVPDQSPIAAGTGGASTARRDYAAAAWYNPAALADGGGFRASLSLFLAFPSIAVESQTQPGEGATTGTQFGVSTPASLSLSYADDIWAIGTYVGVSHGSSVAWPEGWWGRFEAISSSIRVLRVAPFFAFRIPEALNLSFSLGLQVDVGSLEVQRALDMIDFEGRSHLLMWGAGAGGHASVYVEPTEDVSIGFSYKSRTFIRMNGSADFTVPDAFSARAPDQAAATDFWIPDRFSLGAAVRIDDLSVYLDLGLSLFSVRDVVRIELASEGSDDVVQPQSWRDAADVRLGAEYRIIPELTARAGLRYEMAAAPASTLAPSSPDLDRFGVTVGLSADVVPELGFDVHYGYTALLGGSSESLDAPPARYAGEAHFVGIGVHVAVDPTPPGASDEEELEEPLVEEEAPIVEEEAPAASEETPEESPAPSPPAHPRRGSRTREAAPRE